MMPSTRKQALPQTPRNQPRWIRESHQARSQETVQSLMDAALRLFRKHGFDYVTVGDIAREADCSPASIYRRFSDKDGLLHAVHDHFTRQALKRMEDLSRSRAFDGLNLRQLLRAVTTIIWEFSRENQVLLQASYVRALSDPLFARRFVEVRSQVFAVLREHFLRRRNEIGHPHPEIAVDFALRQAMATLTYRIEAAHLQIGLEPLSDKAFINEVTRSFLAYVGAKA